MDKSQRINVKFILLIICAFIFSIQTFIGCYQSNVQVNTSRLGIRQEKINYISNNLNEYQNRIKEETGFQGKIVSKEVDGKDQKYIQFDIDDTTVMQFGTDGGEARITKQVLQISDSSVPNPKKELDIMIVGMEDDAYVSVKLTYKNNTFVSCEYNANDFENPHQRARGDEEQIDAKIKSVASAEELRKLTSTAHSIYDVFEEICNEYNEKNEK